MPLPLKLTISFEVEGKKAEVKGTSALGGKRTFPLWVVPSLAVARSLCLSHASTTIATIEPGASDRCRQLVRERESQT